MLLAAVLSTAVYRLHTYTVGWHQPLLPQPSAASLRQALARALSAQKVSRLPTPEQAGLRAARIDAAAA